MCVWLWFWCGLLHIVWFSEDEYSVVPAVAQTSDSDGCSSVVADEEVGEGEGAKQPPPGVPDPYYPIYLPIDQAFKAKYVFHQRRGKTVQEKFYVFLEHPVGWVCLIYHTTV